MELLSYLSRIIRNPGTAYLVCTDGLTWVAGWGRWGVFFIISVLWSRERVKVYFKCPFRSYAQVGQGRIF